MILKLQQGDSDKDGSIRTAYAHLSRREGLFRTANSSLQWRPVFIHDTFCRIGSIYHEDYDDSPFLSPRLQGSGACFRSFKDRDGLILHWGQPREALLSGVHSFTAYE